MSPETNPPYSVEPYSVAADLLSKFHTSPEWIQALWLIAIPALIFVSLRRGPSCWIDRLG